MRAEDALSELGMDMATVEVVWGAAIQVIHAANHRLTARHPQSSRDMMLVTERLENKYGLDGELADGFIVVKNRLHNHFHTRRLNEREMLESMETGKDFVNRMMGLAFREHEAM